MRLITKVVSCVAGAVDFKLNVAGAVVDGVPRIRGNVEHRGLPPRLDGPLISRPGESQLLTETRRLCTGELNNLWRLCTRIVSHRKCL